MSYKNELMILDVINRTRIDVINGVMLNWYPKSYGIFIDKFIDLGYLTIYHYECEIGSLRWKIGLIGIRGSFLLTKAGKEYHKTLSDMVRL